MHRQHGRGSACGSTWSRDGSVKPPHQAQSPWSPRGHSALTQTLMHQAAARPGLPCTRPGQRGALLRHPPGFPSRLSDFPKNEEQVLPRSFRKKQKQLLNDSGFIKDRSVIKNVSFSCWLELCRTQAVSSCLKKRCLYKEKEKPTHTDFVTEIHCSDSEHC